jgi:nucleoside phosphorylase
MTLAVRVSGAIHAWASQSLTGEGQALLIKAAGEEGDPDVRRWAALACLQQDVLVPPTILLDNISTSNYLLREWSLHVMCSQPSPVQISAVRQILENAPFEHPRVVEWAVHAIAALDNEFDDLLIPVFNEVFDDGVREACVAEMARSLDPARSDFLIGVLDSGPELVVALAVISNVGKGIRTAPAGFKNAVERTTRSLTKSGHAINSLTTEFMTAAMPVGQQRQLAEILSDPAVRAAAQLMLDGDDWEGVSGMSTEIVVGVVIAMDEEFEYFNRAAGGDFEVEPSSDGDTYMTKIFSWADSPRVRMVVKIVGRMGVEHAAIAAAKFLAHYRPNYIVSIGISGALSRDVGLGDVVIADTVTNYLANSKVVDVSGPQRFEFRAAGEPYRTDKWFSDRALGLRYELPDGYNEWLRYAARQRKRVLTSREGARVVRGALAVGPSVVASGSFKNWILSHKRDYLAVDMESSAVASAVWADPGSARLLVIRGISDNADLDKGKLETATNGQVRKLAMAVATRYLVATIRLVAGKVI